MSRIAYGTSSTATVSGGTGTQAITITAPASLAAGDFMIAQIHASASGASAPSIATPTGWTLLHSSDETFYKVGNYYKIATAADVTAGSFSWTVSVTVGNAHAYGYLHRYTGVDPVSPVNTNNHNFSAVGGTSLTSSGITPTNQCLFLILVATRLAAARTISAYAVANNNPTWTERVDATSVAIDASNLGIALADGPSTSTSASGNATATASSAVDTYTLTILALNPEPVRPTALAGLIGFGLPTIPSFATVLALSPTILTPVVNIIAKAWNNVAKNSTTWTNTPKS